MMSHAQPLPTCCYGLDVPGCLQSSANPLLISQPETCYSKLLRRTDRLAGQSQNQPRQSKWPDKILYQGVAPGLRVSQPCQ